jgi:hypothetical protein
MNKQQLAAHIKLEAVGYEHLRIVCPVCNGGSNHERSLSITRMGMQLKYLCHRAQCETRGVIGSQSDSVTCIVSRYKPKRLSTTQTKRIPAELLPLVCSKLGLAAHEADELRIQEDEQRLVFPLHLLNKRIGMVRRKYSWLYPYASGGKALNEIDDADAPLIHFPRGARQGAGRMKSLVLVEDVISAIKVNRVCHCASLMGTNISNAVLKYLLSLGINNIFIALDNDATNKALALRDQYSLFFQKFEVIALTKDPKDMSNAELFNTFDGVPQ